ncbi:MAG: PepSY domain-containing protein [Rhodospirillales bacterium]|jgi:hypothetical protein
MIKILAKWSVLSVALVLFLSFGSIAEAALSKSQVQAAVEKQYDVKVLKIYPGTDAGRAVFFVRVMFNGGNFNTAFQINTLVIDAETGKRVPQFRHGSSGQELSGSYDSRPNRQAPAALRGHIWR